MSYCIKKRKRKRGCLQMKKWLSKCVCVCGVVGWKNTTGAGRNGLHLLLRRDCRFLSEMLTFS